MRYSVFQVYYITWSPNYISIQMSYLKVMSLDLCFEYSIFFHLTIPWKIHFKTSLNKLNSLPLLSCFVLVHLRFCFGFGGFFLLLFVYLFVGFGFLIIVSSQEGWFCTFNCLLGELSRGIMVSLSNLNYKGGKKENKKYLFLLRLIHEKTACCSCQLGRSSSLKNNISI